MNQINQLTAVIDINIINQINESININNPILSLQNFINALNINIDPFVKDNFWNSLENENILVYLSSKVINWLEYESDLIHSKENIVRILNNYEEFEEKVHYFMYDFTQYKQFLSEKDNKNKYPAIPTTKNS